MAVESKQVDIEKNSKMENFAWFKKVNFTFHKPISTTKGFHEK